MAADKTLSTQVELLVQHLRDRPVTNETDKTFPKIIEYVRALPPAARTKDMIELLMLKFSLNAAQLETFLKAKAVQDFDTLVPESGWLRDYITYTLNTEPPTVFHFIVGLVTLGTALRRNVYVRMGSFDIFPNVCAVLVAPSGKCRKTSACNIGVKIIRSCGGTVIADKTTPEALVEAFRDREEACGLLYAPELAVFLGKQKYQEGMVPMLTSLFDAPDHWDSATIGRGELKLTNVALSFLGASTMDWIQTAIPRDAFGGGFMSRLLFVVQETTPRSFPVPPPMDEKLAVQLRKQYFDLTKVRGEVPFFNNNPEARAWFEDWYHKQSNLLEHERQFAGYTERKPGHIIRIAMLLAASEMDPRKMGAKHLQRALRILEWLEQFLPSTFEQLGQNTIGEDHQRMLRQLKAHGGQLEHSRWLRLNSSRFDARTFRERIDTLKQARQIEYDQKTKSYYITPEGAK